MRMLPGMIECVVSDLEFPWTRIELYILLSSIITDEKVILSLEISYTSIQNATDTVAMQACWPLLLLNAEVTKAIECQSSVLRS